MELQALEQRNKNKLEQIFTMKRGEISGYRRATSQVNAYYQAMSGMGIDDISTMDHKK
jgi:4-diphosphocytidyl-2C-methyl-D-erythritol kinase